MPDADQPARSAAPWLTSLVKYEGYPLALRVRQDADTMKNRKEFTRLLLVTHKLAHVKSNGLPEDAYNTSLRAFDSAVHQFVESEGDGIMAFVETFAGKKTYYAYVDAAATFKERFARLAAQHPQHVFTVGNRIEARWETFELYRKLFPW